MSHLSPPASQLYSYVFTPTGTREDGLVHRNEAAERHRCGRQRLRDSYLLPLRRLA